MKKTVINLPVNKMTEIPTDQEISKPVNVVIVSIPSKVVIMEYDDCIDVYIQQEDK